MNIIKKNMAFFGLPVKGTAFSYIKNTGWISVAKIMESLISYVIIVLISRYLGAEGLGQYSFLFSFVGLFFIFADFGLSGLLTKDVAKKNIDVSKYVSQVISINLIMSTICLIIYFGLVFFAFDELIAALLIVGAHGFMNAIRLGPLSVLRARHRGSAIAIVNAVERIISLVGAYVAIVVYHSLTMFVLVLLIATVVRSVLTFYFVRDQFRFKFQFQLKKAMNMLRLSSPFLLVSLFSIVYIRLDTVILSFLKGDDVVGWYNAGYKLVSLLNIIPTLLLIFGFPLFSQWYKKNKQRLRVLFEGILKVSLWVITPCVGGVLLLGDQIIMFIYGFTAVESFIAFKILIVAEFFTFITLIMGNLIAAADKQKYFAKITGYGALFNTVLNFLLIPKWSLYGAGAATLLTYVIMFFMMDYFVKKHILVFDMWKLLIQPFIATLMTVAFVYALDVSHVLANIAIFVGAYALIIGFFLLVSKKN